jgi:hypothetical protein
MKPKPRKLLALILMAGCILLVCLSYRKPYPKPYYATPAVSNEYPELEKEADTVVEAGAHLYVLLNPTQGIVQVYDLNGTYRHTLFFDCHLNGGFSLAAFGETAYVQDMAGNVYVLNNGEFDRYLKKADLSELPEGLDFYATTSSEGYEIRKNAVWRITAEGEECIIPAPPVSIQTILCNLFSACMVAIGVVLFILKHKQDTKGDAI